MSKVYFLPESEVTAEAFERLSSSMNFFRDRVDEQIGILFSAENSDRLKDILELPRTVTLTEVSRARSRGDTFIVKINLNNEEEDLGEEDETQILPGGKPATIDIYGIEDKCHHWGIMTDKLKAWLKKHSFGFQRIRIHGSADGRNFLREGLNLVLGNPASGATWDKDGVSCAPEKKSIGFKFVGGCPEDDTLYRVIAGIIEAMPIVRAGKKKTRRQQAPVEFSALRNHSCNEETLKQIAANILSPILGKMPLAIKFVGGFQSPEDNGKFNIYLHATANETLRKSGITQDKMDEIYYSETAYPWITSGQGLGFLSDNGATIAELIGNNLYLHSSAGCQGNNWEYILFFQILSETAKFIGLAPEEKEKVFQKIKLERRLTIESQPEADSNSFAVMEKMKAVALARLCSHPDLPDVVMHWPKQNRRQDFEASLHDGRLHLWMWNKPYDQGKSPAGKAPETFWGFKSLSGRYEWRHFPSSGNGVDIAVPENGYVIAEIIGDDNLYVLFPIYDSRIEQGDKIFDKILEAAVEEFTAPEEVKAKRKAEWRAKMKAAACDAYLQQCSKRYKREIATLTETIRSNQGLIRAKQKELTDLIRSIGMDEMRLSGIKGLNGQKDSKFLSEFDVLWNMPGVENITITESVIMVFTEHIFIQPQGHPDIFDIGKFRMEIYPHGDNGGLLFFNITRQGRGSYNGYNTNHPHVRGDGQPCLGNIKEVIAQLLAGYEFSVIAQLGMEFLKQVNLNDDAGKQIFNCWPKITQPAKEVA